MRSKTSEDDFLALQDCRRAAPRHAVQIPGHVCSTALGHVSCFVMDISRAGCRVECRAYLHPGEFMVLKMPSLAPLGARVAWWDGRAVGLEFGQPIGTAVVEHVAEGHPRPH